MKREENGSPQGERIDSRDSTGSTMGIVKALLYLWFRHENIIVFTISMVSPCKAVLNPSVVDASKFIFEHKQHKRLSTYFHFQPMSVNVGS